MSTPRRRVCIVGAGAAGIATAYCLNQHPDRFEFVVFEKAAAAGGNATVVDVPVGERSFPVDIGVLFFNQHCRHMLNFIERYGIEYERMIGSLSVEHPWGSWAHGDFSRLGPGVRDELDRFERSLQRVDAIGERLEQAGVPFLNGFHFFPLGFYCRVLGFSRMFRLVILRPNMEFLAVNSAAIFAIPVSMLAYIARRIEGFTLAEPIEPFFFSKTTRDYYDKVTVAFRDKIRLGVGVASVARGPDGVRVTDASGAEHRFDELIMACNADDALAILARPTALERWVLGHTRYQESLIVVHHDESMLGRESHAIRNFNLRNRDKIDRYEITGMYSNIQAKGSEKPILVSYRPASAIAPDKIVGEFRLKHVIHDVAHHFRVAAISRHLQGHASSWYVGAHVVLNFHEAAIISGIAVARALGADYPFGYDPEAKTFYNYLGPIVLGRRFVAA